ncbi:hypothetical protein QPL79_03375 [Ignisphaera sp. 4213-co]|uniref:UPF0282 protein QPL79_03375 n=1 Tax=Ignisphaera cupida TaxID=3050454 RepID=A0ABD4Z8H2_9CREN|nr:hypothetical protein [Ignisphaera sp. 4213-co]MDK6028403.1 hypothetical protein [Ignisphaera sp. 4213-co]
MNIVLIGFESFGVRSQATFIQTKHANIFIDPSAALAPKRYGLPPHKLEVKKLIETFNKIENFLRDSEYIIVTHYHYDHHDPGKFLDPTFFKGKTILIKDFEKNINFSQKLRAQRFISIIKNFAKNIVICDQKIIEMGTNKIVFSKPLPHGINTRLGYVISVCIKDEYEFLFTSDIEGGTNEEHSYIYDFCKPYVAIVDGPPTYLMGYAFSEKDLHHSLNFLKTFIDKNSNVLKYLILDHHAFRDENYASLVQNIRNSHIIIETAAEFMGFEPKPLEALRKGLYMVDNESGLDLLHDVVKHGVEPDE